jgi:hypothetical protein
MNMLPETKKETKGIKIMAEQVTYPSISEKNWWTIREKFKSSLPATVSANYIKTLLTLGSEDSAKSNVILPMKRLGLIDENNKPTQLANDWRLDDKYKATCEIMIKSVYSQELLDLFPDENFDRNSVNGWFMGHGVGSGAAGKMTALFALLRSGEIKDIQSQKTSNAKKPTTKPKSSTKLKALEDDHTNNQDVTETPVSKTTNNIGNRPNLHIDLQIHISPDSTPEQIETIFASMAKHFYGVENS